MKASTTTSQAGTISFVDAFEPGLKEGTYRLTASQGVSADGASIAETTQLLWIQGARFTLAPEDVHCVFPPKGATGDFSEALPHILLSRRLAPWERAVPGLDDRSPWLALLVFHDGELVDAPPGGLGSRTRTVAELLGAEAGVRKPSLTAVSDQELASACQTITFAAALFADLLPAASELSYLAHARAVEIDDKACSDLGGDGWFSVVVSNRLPRPGADGAATRATVHLVSLEGFGDLLADEAPSAPVEAKIEMVSLASWTFSTLPDSAQTFSGLARGLTHDSAGAPLDAASLRLRLPGGGSNAEGSMAAAVDARLDAGYVALGYHAPSGEDGFAWYRGPLTPVVPSSVPSGDGFATSDAAMIFDPSTGVFDQSLAAAWQIGRALAVSNQAFSIALMRLRRGIAATLERNDAAPSQTHVDFASLVRALPSLGEATRSGRLTAPRRPRTRAHQAPQSVARRAALTLPNTRDTIAETLAQSPDAAVVAAWLGQLLLLRGVPFIYLVPDARMLPAESIRFFYVDSAWQGALLDGAMSVGINTSHTSCVQRALSAELRSSAQGAALAWRAATLKTSPPPSADGPLAGFLIRSALVSGWPGVTFVGTRGGATIPLIRFERLGGDVLLGLFNGVPDALTVTKPIEGLEFGVDDEEQINLRTLDGTAVIDKGRIPAILRPGDARVLHLRSGASAETGIVESIAEHLAMDPAKVSSSLFALQMIKGPEVLQFSLTTP